nr:hypothetical protein [Candidatus Krumholzibacteria bacterium]
MKWASILLLILLTPVPGFPQDCLDYAEGIYWTNEWRLNAPAYDVAIYGHHAFFAEGYNGLWWVDLDDLERRHYVGPLPAAYISSLKIVDSHAFVANSDGLTVLDISDPENAFTVGHMYTPHGNGDISIQGSYAFLREYARIRAVDISQPEDPQTVGYGYVVNNYLADLEIDGNYAFVLQEQSGLYILDIQDPTNIHLVGHLDTPGSAWRLAVSGHFAYVADTNDGVQVVDFSDPTNPVIVSNFNVLGYTKYIAISGHYCYVGRSGQF